jgi:4,5-dihydroxyphthalate decarboxylase
VNTLVKPRLKVAISHYDRFIPLLDGTAEAEGFELDAMHVSQSGDGRYGSRRHERMIQDGEFDVAELSLSSYIMACARGLPFTAIPVFPRRLFSQSQIWVNATRGIREPRDLIGKRVGLSTFQTTLSVLAKGDLQEEYGVPWRKIEWVTNRDETVSFKPEPGVVITKVPDDRDLGKMLQEGEIDAIFRPHPPKAALQGAADIRRLFGDPKAEEARFYHKVGFYPIMHVIALRQDVVEAHPEAPRSLLELFTRIDRVVEEYYDDPNWSRLVWGRLDIEEERRLLGRDLWPTGVAKNRANLERFIGYSLDQGLIDRRLPVESLFAASVVDT